MKWLSNTRFWTTWGDFEARVEFSGGVWSWLVVDAEEMTVSSGSAATAALCKRAAAAALRRVADADFENWKARERRGVEP